MIKGTTPTFIFTLRNKEIDLGEADNVYVTFAQSNKIIEKTGEFLEVDGPTVSTWLTQSEAMKLTEFANAKVQINWTYANPFGGEPRRAATKVITIPITEQLLKRVIE
jgi:hypothetical protein